MTMEEALAIIEKQLSDYKATAESYESVFPGAVSAYHDLIDAHELAVKAMKKTMENDGGTHAG